MEENKTPFEESVEQYSVSDQNDIEKKRKQSVFRSLLIRSVLIALFIGLLGYSVYRMGSTFIENYQAEKEYEDIRVEVSENQELVLPAEDMAEPNNLPTVMEFLNAQEGYDDYVGEKKSSSSDPSARYNRIYKNFMNLTSDYPRMYAWIYMTDTSINYPVMKGRDNSYYLTHNYKDEEYRAGSIMADYRMDSDYYGNLNMIIIGHDMRNGTMFGSLRAWCGSAGSRKYTDHSKIEIYTRDGLYIYKILSYYIDEEFAYDRPTFKDENDYLDYLEDITLKSFVHSKQTFEKDSHIVTLVTCTNGKNKDARYVVHGILEQYIAF